MLVKIIQILATIMGVVMSLGYYPQAYKIYKTKSANDVSVSAFIIFSLGTTTWFVYGLVIKDLPIIAGFVLGVIGSIAVLVLTLKYRNK